MNRALLTLSFLLGTQSLAQDGGLITGKVEATPARFLSETVVFLREVKVAPTTHRTVPIDQKGMRFIPHVVAIEAGDSVEFLNHDAVEHNVFTPDNEGYNLGMIKPSGSGRYTFDHPGVYTQLCSVHAEMLAYVYVGTSPYQTVVDAHGAFRLEHVPPGTYSVAVWNSHLKAPDQMVQLTEGKSVQLTFTVQR